MVISSQPTCLRCGGPVFNHILRGYVCPSCRQVDATRKAAERIAQAQERMAQAQERNTYYQADNHDYYNDHEYHEDREPSNFEKTLTEIKEFFLGLGLVMFIIFVIYKMISSVFHGIVSFLFG